MIYIIFVGIFHLLFALVSRIELHVLNEMQLIIFIIFFPGTTSKLLILRTVLSVVVVCCLNQRSILKLISCMTGECYLRRLAGPDL